MGKTTMTNMGKYYEWKKGKWKRGWNWRKMFPKIKQYYTPNINFVPTGLLMFATSTFE